MVVLQGRSHAAPNTTGVFDVAVIGGGAIGVSTLKHLAESHRGRFVLLEKEDAVAFHTSGRNSGVVHSGYNQKPGTLKAKFAVEGNRRMRAYCKERGVALREWGTIVVALSDAERPVLEELVKRGAQNGIDNLRVIGREELRKREPHAAGVAALLSPNGASVDSAGYVRAMAEDARKAGAEIRLGCRVDRVEEHRSEYAISTNLVKIRAHAIVNAAGLYADKIARQLGAGLEYSIVPFRGEYWELVPHRRFLCTSMIYHVPDLEFPFLGVHFTRRFDDRVILGPNAVVAFGRESYRMRSIHIGETARTMTNPGFLRLFRDKRFRGVARSELMKSVSKKAFLREAQRLVPALRPDDCVRSFSGIRAQLVHRSGKLVDDLVIEEKGRAIHVLNAVSPGLTSSLPFGEEVARRAAELVGLRDQVSRPATS